MNSFGIYILTYPGDFHLSVPLVKSIKYFHPDIPIMILPGEGFDRDNHPFDVPIMPEPSGFWSKLCHQDRDLWSYQGPFEKFLYLDADIICTKSLDRLIRRVEEQEGDFIFVHIPSDWGEVVKDSQNPKYNNYIAMAKNRFGSFERIKEFDPDYNIEGHCPFNTGLVASRRLAITESDIESHINAETAYYSDKLGKEFTWKSKDLFNRDQGRWNYLAGKLGIPVIPVSSDGNWVSGGWVGSVSVDGAQQNECDFYFIHWCGAPRPSPSLLCDGPGFWITKTMWVKLQRKRRNSEYLQLSEIPGYSLWKHYYEKSFGPISVKERLVWTRRDFKKYLGLGLRRVVLGR